MFNPDRLELARKRRGLNKVSLAKSCAISRDRLHKLLTDEEIEPTDDELAAFSDVLDFPKSFFLSAASANLGTPSFRALSTMTAAERDMATSVAQIAFYLYRWIDERYQTPEPDIPDLSMYTPDVAAMSLRSHWGIGERPIGNMVRLLEANGVRVFSLAEKTRRVDAFSLWAGHTPFVFLNTAKTPEHARTDAAHELGHLVMHHHGDQTGKTAEREAQAFAGVFLVPEKSAIATVGRLRSPSISNLVRLKKAWKVSVALLAHRLHELDLLSYHYYRGICIQLNRYGRGWEPEGIERETSGVMEQVFGDLKNYGVTRADVARDLNVYPKEVDDLVFGLGRLGWIDGGGNGDYDADADFMRKKIRPV